MRSLQPRLLRRPSASRREPENYRAQWTRGWFAATGAGVIAVLAIVLIPSGTAVWTAVYAVTVLAALGVLLRTTLRMPRDVRPIWGGFFAFQVLVVLADTVTDLQHSMHQSETTLSVADGIFLFAYVPVLYSLIVLVRRLHLGPNREAWIDTLILAVAGAAVLGAFLIAPAAIGLDTTPIALAVTLSFPMLDLLALCALIWLIADASRPNPSLVLLAASFVAYLSSDVLRDLSLSTGFTDEMWGYYEALATGALILVAAAASAPGARTITRSHSEFDGAVTPSRILALALGVITIPIIVAVRVAGSDLDIVTVVLAIAGVAIIVLTIWRIAMLVRLVERQRRLTELVLDSAADGVVGMDHDGIVVFANLSSRRVLRCRDSDLIGRRFHDVAHHHHPDGTEFAWEDCPLRSLLTSVEGAAVAGQILIRRDGTSFPVEMVVTPLMFDGEHRGSVVSFRDVSERLAIAEVQRQFVSIVSHELRTPLTSIKGSLQLLDSDLFGSLSDDQQSLVSMAVNNSERLVRLVNDILDLERLDSGRMPLAPLEIDAGELVGEAVAGVRGAAVTARVTLTTELPAHEVDVDVFADPHRLGQVLVNLVGNAIKFSDVGSTVRVSVRRVGEQVSIGVHDVGRGIPEDQLARVFDRFGQVEMEDSREHGGTGLGLAIAKEIVERSGGTIVVDSQIGRGSTFTVTLPAAHVETTVIRVSPA